MHWLPALVCGVVGLLTGWLVPPRLIRALPEPELDPDEDPADFPDKVLYVDLAARAGLPRWCAIGCGVSGAAIGAAVGWNWSLPWLLYLLPVCCALTVVDYVTWYLPSRIIWPSYAVVLVLQGVAALVLGEPRVLIAAAIGWVALGAYYGLMWLISPRLMAFGDVRLGALMGLALGPFGLPTLLISVVAAALLGVLALLPLHHRGNSIRRRVPFGPFLTTGAVVAVVAGQVLVSQT